MSDNKEAMVINISAAELMNNLNSHRLKLISNNNVGAIGKENIKLANTLNELLKAMLYKE